MAEHAVEKRTTCLQCGGPLAQGVRGRPRKTCVGECTRLAHADAARALRKKSTSRALQRPD